MVLPWMMFQPPSDAPLSWLAMLSLTPRPLSMMHCAARLVESITADVRPVSGPLLDLDMASGTVEMRFVITSPHRQAAFATLIKVMAAGGQRLTTRVRMPVILQLNSVQACRTP